MSHATTAQLQAALAHVQAAPRDHTTVSQLCFRPRMNAREFPEQLTLTRAEGIPGDRWLTSPWLVLPDRSPDPRIQVSILSQRVLDAVWLDRTGAPHPGDPIVCDLDTSEDNLPPGSLLAVGTAVVRVSDKFNSGCVKWRVRYGQPALDWIVAPEHHRLRLRGLLCSVERDGSVRVGDPVRKLDRS